ncbi:MAG: hypothetical protein IAI49_04800, partial [Candidatus Eremiobacteraeota bacterium]|nr:hypothetical protein [Candidatus Eremiobacteraeota bacterium]
YDLPVDIYGSILYYPSISGDYVDIFGNAQQLQYRYLKYQAGLNINVPRTPFFLDAGFIGNKGGSKQNAPSNIEENSLYGGLGLHF